MKSATIKASLAFLLAFFLAAEGASQENVLTIKICCGSQGIVDAPHQLSVTVKRDGKRITAIVDIHPTSSSEGIAGALAATLSDLGVAADATETANERFKSAKHTAEDVNLGAGWSIGKVKVQKLAKNGVLAEDDGHLKAYSGKKKVSNNDVILGIGPGFTTLSFSVAPGTAAPLSLELDLYGRNRNERTAWHTVVTYTEPFAHPLEGLGVYLESIGIGVTYPSSTRMSATIPPEMRVYQAYFLATQASGPSSTGMHTSQFALNVE